MKTYIIKKYVKAKPALDAIKKKPRCEVHDVYVYENNGPDRGFRPGNAIGFEASSTSSEYEFEEKNTQ